MQKFVFLHQIEYFRALLIHVCMGYFGPPQKGRSGPSTYTDLTVELLIKNFIS